MECRRFADAAEQDQEDQMQEYAPERQSRQPGKDPCSGTERKKDSEEIHTSRLTL
jgi:hypothetical protein